jgi:NAD(P) transhydrogenase
VPYDYDLLVIGSGPAGEKAAVQAAYFGKRVAVVDKAPEPGGAAVHTGTLPSKTLRETALFLSGHRQRELYGISVSIDSALAVPKLLSRKDAVRGLEVQRIRDNLARHHVEYLCATARFVDAHAVALSSKDHERVITSEVIVIATGSTPFHPSHIPFEDPSIDDSDTILELDRLPSTMVVIGAGVIGCEYASMFAAMNVHVTLIEPRSELLSFLDADMSEALRLGLIKLGIDVRLNESAGGVRRAGEHIVVDLRSGPQLAVDRVLFAAGRSGQTEGLNTEAIGVRLGQRGSVAVDDNYRTSVPSIYAVGDVIGFPALASTSMEQGRVAVCHAFGFTYLKKVSALLPYGIYTIPEVSCVGLSEEDAAAKGVAVVVGRASYADNARGKIIGDYDGVVKLVFERATQRLIGAHCIGDRATELVHLGLMMITLGGTVSTLIEMVFNYPTLSECFKYAAYDALGKLNAADGEQPRS